MRTSAIHTVRLGLILVSVCWVTSTAEAAKGVKKVTLPDGQQILTGTVIAMAPDGKGGGSFKLKSSISGSKNGATNSAASGASSNTTGNSTTATGNSTNTLTGTRSGNYMLHTLHASASTQFQHQNPAANGKPLTVGSHVRVVTSGNQAQSVQVLSSNNSSMNRFMRHRMGAYYPHVPHHHLHRR